MGRERQRMILLPGKRKIAFVPICGISPGGRFFQTIYGVARRSSRSPSLAFPQERRPTPVALRGKATCATERVWGELGLHLRQCAGSKIDSHRG